MSEIDLRVVAADDRQHTRRIEVGVVEDGPKSVVLVEIPADWLALGVNRVEISSDEEQPRVLASPFSLALESRDQAVGDDGPE
jgi:flagellar biogenesis protein FliO